MQSSLGWDEIKYLDFFKTNNDKDEVFLLDIGANVGDFTYEFIRNFPKGKAICFEPIKEIYKQLFFRFEFDDRITMMNAGLSDEDNFNASIWYVESADGYNNSTGLSSLYYRDLYYPKWNVKEMKIQLFMLDHIFDYNNPEIDYMKIDVEGNEFKVLSGAKKVFETRKPKYVQWEYGQCYEDAGVTGKQVLELMKNYGYRTYNRDFNEQNHVTFVEKYADVQNFLSIRSDLIK